MATISLIQGTDSLSSSRVTLNDNFTAINDELNLVTAIVDPTTTNITGVASLSATSVTIASGTSAAFTATGNTLTADTVVDGKSTLNGGLVYGVEAIGAAGLPNALAFESSTYVIDALTAPSVTLNAALSGQEITLIADAGVVTIANPTDVAGATVSITIPQNGTLTVRYVGTSWYIIGSFLTVIV